MKKKPVSTGLSEDVKYMQKLDKDRPKHDKKRLAEFHKRQAALGN